VIPLMQCRYCAHYRGENGVDCAAFPAQGSIPREIFDTEFDHRNPYPGDHGVRWEPREWQGKPVTHPLDEHDEAAT